MINVHFHVEIIQRSKGRNLVCKAGYNSRTNQTDLNTGIPYYKRSKGGLVYEAILIPSDSPKWLREMVKDREKFYSTIEKGEPRKDSQLGRELDFSLPHELSDPQNINLVERYIKKNFVGKGMVADISIHRAPKGGDSRNVHAHVLLTMREMTPNGFGNKNRSWNNRKLVSQWRKSYCNLANQYLERNGFEPRFDHRSFKELKIDKEPTRYQGRSYRKSKQMGKERNAQNGPINVMKILREIMQENDQDREIDNFENER